MPLFLVAVADKCLQKQSCNHEADALSNICNMSEFHVIDLSVAGSVMSGSSLSKSPHPWTSVLWLLMVYRFLER